MAQPSWCLRDGLLETWMRDKSKHSRILDIGAGSGETERRLVQAGFENIIAIDLESYLDTDFIGIAPELHLLDVSKEIIPLEDASVDVVFLLQMLEHLENPWHCIREAVRVTKKGGDVFFAIPFSTSFVNRVKYLLTGDVESYSAKNNHVALFSEGLVTKLLGDQLMEVDRYYSEGFIRLPFHKKIRFRRGLLKRMFSRKIAFHLKKC